LIGKKGSRRRSPDQEKKGVREGEVMKGSITLGQTENKDKKGEIRGVMKISRRKKAGRRGGRGIKNFIVGQVRKRGEMGETEQRLKFPRIF